MKYYKVRHYNEDKLLVEHKGVFTLNDGYDNLIHIIFDDISKDMILSGTVLQDAYIPGFFNIPGGPVEVDHISFQCQLFTNEAAAYKEMAKYICSDLELKSKREMFFNEFGMLQEFAAVYKKK